MNNGENNNIQIEPVTIQQTTVQNNQNVTESNQTVAQPVIQTTLQPIVQPVSTQIPVENNQQQVPVQTPNNTTTSLGSNVKIAPAQPFYNPNGTINETPKVEQQKEVPKIENNNIPPQQPPQIQMKVQEQSIDSNSTPVKQKKSFTLIFLLLIIILIGIVIYQYLDKQSTVAQMNYECTPVSTNGEEKELDLNSTIVQELYSKVKTTIKEDLADNNLDDQMKLYLAYRQIPSTKIYSSNCNYFSEAKITNFTCNDQSFTPTAFKEETIQLEIKKLFGERTNIELQNVQLGQTCIGGYEYIAERGEFVEGQCSKAAATEYSVTKELTKAISKDNTIVLTEDVKYKTNESLQLPDYLKSGYYIYTFKLDTNYNYAYINREYKSKY